MPVVRMQPRNSEVVLVREKRDSAGRDEKQVWAMEQNDPKPPRVSGVDKLYAEQIAEEYKVYPKVMYRLAIKQKMKDGKPDPEAEPVFKGDRINPNYPMPFALAVENGYQGQVTGHGSDKGVNIVHPYVTCFVPLSWDPIYSTHIDAAECKKDEAYLVKNGWVDHPGKLEGLPQRNIEVD